MLKLQHYVFCSTIILIKMVVLCKLIFVDVNGWLAAAAVEDCWLVMEGR